MHIVLGRPVYDTTAHEATCKTNRVHKVVAPPCRPKRTTQNGGLPRRPPLLRTTSGHHRRPATAGTNPSPTTGGTNVDMTNAPEHRCKPEHCVHTSTTLRELSYGETQPVSRSMSPESGCESEHRHATATPYTTRCIANTRSTSVAKRPACYASFLGVFSLMVRVCFQNAHQPKKAHIQAAHPCRRRAGRDALTARPCVALHVQGATHPMLGRAPCGVGLPSLRGAM